MQKKLNLINTLLFLALIFGFAVAFWILPDASFSEQENRSLRTFPAFSLEKLASGEFSDEINDYFADQFPIRDHLVGMKGVAELAMGKGENDGVLLGRDGQLAKRLFDVKCADGTVLSDLDAFDPDHIRAATAGINRAAQSLEIPFSTLLTGRTVDIAASAFAYPDEYSKALLEALYEGIGAEVNAVDTVPMLRALYENGEYVYYRTDHHWTTLGAYYAYAEWMRSIGMEDEIIPAQAFEKQTVSTSFYGTAWSAGGMKMIAPDSIEFWTLGNEDEFCVVADGTELDGFYSTRYLSRKDQYSAFLDGTHDVVTVTKKNDEDRQTLLILKDSFANSIAPFLAQHFDLVLLNLSSARTDFTDITTRAAEYQADAVLLLYTVENIVTADKLEKLR